MDASPNFRSAYLAWMSKVWERLEELDCADTESDGPVQSSAFALEMRRLRRECEVLAITVHTQRSIGQIGPQLEGFATTLLHDLHWLLEISPSASPVLARQCVRMAQDRVFDEVQMLSGIPPQELVWAGEDDLACVIAGR